MEEIKVSEMLQAESINKDDSVMIIQEGVNKKAGGSIQTATGTSLSLTSVADTCKIKSNSKNLVNPDTLLIGYQIDGAGTIAVNSNRAVTDYINVKPETSYVVSGCTPKVTVFYDSTNTLISTITNATTYTTPADTKYIRYGIDITADYSQMQLEEGSTATSYNPYNTEVMITKSKNMFNQKQIVNPPATGTSTTIILDLLPNTEYTMSTNCPKSNGGTTLIFFASGTSVTGLSTDNNGVWNGQTRTFTSDNNGNMVIAYRRNNSDSSINLTDYWYQVEQGSATTYEEYSDEMQRLALTPSEEKSAFTYDTKTIVGANGSVTIEYNTQSRLLNNNDTLAIKEYVDRETEEIYSTEETKIGTFMGKPLYRKVFVINATIPSNSASSGGSVTIFNKSTYNADEVFIKSCRVDNSDNSVSIYVPYAGGQPRYIGISRISNNINVSFYNAFSNENVKITSIIEYTKTTDA